MRSAGQPSRSDRFSRARSGADGKQRRRARPRDESNLVCNRPHDCDPSSRSIAGDRAQRFSENSRRAILQEIGKFKLEILREGDRRDAAIASMLFPTGQPAEHGACRRFPQGDPLARAASPALTEPPASALARACRLRGECRSCLTWGNFGFLKHDLNASLPR